MKFKKVISLITTLAMCISMFSAFSVTSFEKMIIHIRVILYHSSKIMQTQHTELLMIYTILTIIQKRF